MDQSFLQCTVRGRIRKIQELFFKKQKEYAPGSDKMHNFRTAARMLNTSMEDALRGMLMKHIVSVNDMIEKTQSNPEYKPEHELVSEKIGDIINYYILLEAMLYERSCKV
jgi:hypothetical protein